MAVDRLISSGIGSSVIARGVFKRTPDRLEYAKEAITVVHGAPLTSHQSFILSPLSRARHKGKEAFARAH